MSIKEFKKLESNLGGLISFNNFLSTSADKNTAYNFAFGGLGNAASKAVLFEIDLSFNTEENSSMNCVFASVKECSSMQREDEVLFSMHTIFRIKGIIEMSNGIYRIILTLTNDTDKELRAVTEFLCDNIRLRQKGLHQLCALMDLMGNVDRAIEIGQIVLNEMPKNDFKELANINNELGRLCTSAKRYNEALQCYENMEKIIVSLYPNCLENVLARASIYANMAHVNHLQGNDEKGEKRMVSYNKATECFQPFLDLLDAIDYDNSSSDNLRTIAINFNNIGLLYHDKAHELGSDAKNVLENALSMFEKAREFYRRCDMPAIYPDLALLLNNIALIQIEMKNTREALKNLQSCVAMQEKVLPSIDHPSIARTCYNLSGCFIALDKLDDAKRYAERAAKIAGQHADPELKDYEELIKNIALLQSDFTEFH